MGQESASNFVSYCGRRFMPSVAGTLLMDSSEASTLGNWTSGKAKGQGLSLANTMHVRYDDTKIQLAARTKVAIIHAIREA
eukprot:8045965-Lingulodinium_polyedra.AAC.1